MTLDQRITRLIKQHADFRIIGGAGVNVQGDLSRGYTVESEVSSSAGRGTVETPSGACCIDGFCFENIEEGDCLGDYLGDGTTCAGVICDRLGCTDPGAINYDPDANIDDGSCEYAFGACCFNDDCFIDTEFSCETYGEYQGDDTECEPNPCPAPTGACCEPDGSCFESTEDDCDGEYQGDDTLCVDVDCPTDCPSITTLCDSISAAKSKCGLRQDGDDKYYLLKTETFESSGTYGRGTHCQTTNTDITFDIVYSYSGSSTTTVTLPDCTEDTVNTCVGEMCGTPSEDCEQFGHCGTGTSCDSLCGNLFFDGHGSCQDRAPGGCWFTFSMDCPVLDTSFDNEYTTDMLISNTEAALPPYSGEYTGGACASSRFLSSDEATYSIQRSKPQFSFAPVGFDFYVCYNEHFTPAGGGDGYDVPQCIFVPAGDTEVVGPELFEPPENGTTVIRDVECLPA